MYSQQSNKCLVAIVKDFLKEFDDELTVKRGQVVQFVGKLDRYWFEVYCDGQTGKVPISSCREWNSQEMSSIRLVKASQQAAFVSKYDFLNDCVEGDLRFSAFEIIIGFEAANDDWWKGARLASIKNSITSLSVKKENCGIFPLTHVWRLREDLLPDSVFTANGVIISSSNDSSEIEPALGVPVPEAIPEATEHFYVKVKKTMTPHLREEMELPEIGEILLVTAIPDKLYYFGQSLDGARVGMFPKHFVQVEDNYEPPPSPPPQCDLHSTNSSTSSPIPSSNLPPPTIPPPSPPHISINFGKHLSVDFADGQGNRLPRTPVDTPPSYEAAICCEPVSYGYATQMFSEIESYGRVLFNFDAQDENELTLRESQIVRLFRHVDDGWMEGELDGKVGLFPKSYIDIIVDCEANAPADFVADSSTGGGANSNCQNQVVAIDYPPNTRARVLYDFDPEMEQDLRVRAGETIVLLKHFTTTDWVEACNASGTVGFIHLNFCEMLSSVPQPPAAATEGSSSSQSPHEKSSHLYANIDSFTTSTEQKVKPPEQQSVVVKPPASSTSFAGTSAYETPVPAPGSSEHELLSISKPHRPAPRAPRRTNIFPTFNQFLMNEKQDIEQFEIGPGPSGGSGGGGASVPNSQASSGEPQKGTSVQSLASNKRQCVITELIQTERDYCHAMNVCLNVFRGKSAEAERCGVDTEKLFGTMKTVVDVSKSLLKLLDNYANNRPFVDQRVGICFLDLKFELRDAFVSYCKSHDSTSMLLRFYEADSKSSDFMRRCQTEIQRQTNCFDLASIVIKPVQRILKYPLLINELSKCTEEGHTDWEPLQRAMEMLTDIAQSINENKRRQDLIQKYCKSSDTSFSSRLKSLNAHTVKKKGSRIANRIISTLTFSSVHNDENYDAVFHKFQGVDKAIRSFVKCIQAYLNSLNEYYHQSLAVANSMLEYYGSKKEVEDLRTTHHEIYTKYFADFRAVVERDVVNLLYKLTDKFKGPWILINKRKDKLVDYDASLKSKNSDCNLAKNTFEALNQQLIEELPMLTDLSLQVFVNCLQTFTTANKTLIMRSARLFLTLHQLPFIKNSPFGYYQDIEEAFRVKHNLVFSQMLHDFSLIHSSAFPNTANGPHSGDGGCSSTLTGTLSRLHIHRSSTSSNTWKNSLPARKTSQGGGTSDNDKKVQDSSQKRKLIKSYRQDDLFIVRQTYTPCDVLDLYAQQEDIVGVIKRKDPSGQDHRWYVDRGEMKGFLPQAILAPYQKQQNASLFQTQHSASDSLSSLGSSQSAEMLPLPSYENVDLLTADHRYDSVPEEEANSDPHSSLLSFDEIEHPAASFETQNSLLQFDPLLAPSSSQNHANSSPSSVSEKRSSSNHSANQPSSSSVVGAPPLIPQPSTQPPSTTVDAVYHAAYPFKAGDQNQLSLEFGQRVLVKAKCDLQGNGEWWLVKSALGKEGYVPANYLRKN